MALEDEIHYALNVQSQRIRFAKLGIKNGLKLFLFLCFQNYMQFNQIHVFFNLSDKYLKNIKIVRMPNRLGN